MFAEALKICIFIESPQQVPAKVDFQRWHFELGMYLCFYLPEDLCQTCKTTKKIRPDMLQPFGVYFCRKLARLDNAEKIFVSFERRRKHLCT
jgi:hypothetical protein